MPYTLTKSTRITLFALGIATILLSLLPWFAWSERSRRLLYAEEAGLLEVASAVLWLGLAASLFIIFRPTNWRVTAAAVVCLFAAAREASWHDRFTGYSVMKIGYYLDPSYPFAQRLLFAVAIAVGVACIVIVGLTLFRHLRENPTGQAAWVQHLLLVLVVGVTAKVLDRSPAIIEDATGVALPTLLAQIMHAWEEGLEMLLPVLLFIAALLFVRARMLESASVAHAVNGCRDSQ
ncbi:hypothetical protein ACERK3_19500 [Phycisphaerales bacterium AB-hyl4]|uniref:Uncharacterized protein n=1 Tax=Natronomicrosphaera hydrolytica TaxID=3242702 RepID=A0ABV4UCT4_9BACT